MREKGSWSEATFKTREAEVKATGRGSSTFEGEQRAQAGKGLDRLVDPKEMGVIRMAKNLLVPQEDFFVLEFGAAMPVLSLLDTTGSMGGNVDVAFRVLPKVQNLLVQGRNAVLARYHTQIATGVIQDMVDRFPFQWSQFEPDNEVERQMGLLVPDRNGGDLIEDYQLGLFGAAYLTDTSIAQYGLRGYCFIVGDQIGRGEIRFRDLQKVFGPQVLEKAFGLNASQDIPSLAETAQKFLQNWHGFYLSVGNNEWTLAWWRNLLGRERVIVLPCTDDLAEIQACIIGLTEGVLDFQSAQDFLKEAAVAPERAVMIIEALKNMPVGLQKSFPNFNRIPLVGSKFASREDIWPMGSRPATGIKKTRPKTKPAPESEPSSKKSKKDEPWKL